MVKAVSRGQALEVSALCGNGTLIDWEQLDGDRLQLEVISLSPEERGRRMTAFLRAGMRFNFGGLKVATAPFDPKKFCSEEWDFWKGPKDGDGKSGEEERSKASLALTEIDFDKVDFLSNLEGKETLIKGETKLDRVNKLGRIVYGTTAFAGLWQNYTDCQNKAESVLEKLYQQKGISLIYFFGDVLRSPHGYRYVLYLYRGDDGAWNWCHNWLDDDFNSHNLVAVSQQVSS